jgi:hypothetical protein
MTTSDPDAWIAARVDALEVANGVTVEKIAELEERVRRLERALDALRAAFADAARLDLDAPTVQQNAARASRAQEGPTGQDRQR